MVYLWIMHSKTLESSGLASGKHLYHLLVNMAIRMVYLPIKDGDCLWKVWQPWDENSRENRRHVHLYGTLYNIIDVASGY